MATTVEDISAAAMAEGSQEPVEPLSSSSSSMSIQTIKPLNGNATLKEPITTKRKETSPRTPVPKFQLAVILLVQFAEPLTADVIYPFVNQFVRRTGVTKGDEKATGYYAGIIESIFFLSEGATALAWQRASDRWGRRPFLVLAPLGLALAMMAFGLSKTYLSLVIARCFQGIFNGDIGISKTVMGEITDSTNRAEVLSMIPIMWSVGTTLSPFIGGVFSYPAQHWPETFGRIALFRDNPFFLPCLISAIFALLAFGMAFVGLKETAPAIMLRRKQKARERSHAEGLIDETQPLLRDGHADYGSSTESTPPSEAEVLASTHVDYESATKVPTIRELMTRPIVAVLANYGIFACTDMFNYALQPLVWTTSIHNGGLGFDAWTVGTINTAFGIPNAILQFFALSRVIRYVGPRRLTQATVIANLIYLLLYPLENYFARQAGGADWRVWTLIVIQLILTTLTFAGYASLQIYLVEVSPNPASLGTLQGLGQTVAVVCRAASPSIATSLFAFSTEKNILSGYFVFAILSIADIIAIRGSMFLPEI